MVAIVAAVVALGKANGAGDLDRKQACSKFFGIVSDYTMSDEESADQFGDLAGRTADPALASAIQGVADGFARHDEDIPTTPVTDLCP